MSWQTENRAPQTEASPRSHDMLRQQQEPIREAGPIGKARETIGYLSELEAIMRELRIKVYGPSPEDAQNNAKSGSEPCLEILMMEVCHRAAALTGDARNLLSRLD